MTNNIVLDSSFLVALFDETDNFHERAKNLHVRYKQLQLRPIILDIVVNETISVISRRLKQKQRNHLLQERLTTVSTVFSNLGIQRTSDFVQVNFKNIITTIIMSEGAFSFNDALIVSFLQENNITRFLSFDSDFDSIQTIQRISSAEQLKKE